MAFDSYGPFDTGVGAAISQAEWIKFCRAIAPTPGVVGAQSTSDLVVTTDGASGLHANVAVGEAWLDGTWGRNTATSVVDFTSNASGNPRIDRVVVRRTASTKVMALVVLAGTPAAVPAAPAVTQTRGGVFELSLAQVRVESGAANIAANKTTDERTFVGVDVRVCRTLAELPNPDSQGAIRYESSTGRLLVWDGAGFDTFYDPNSDGLPIGAMLDYGGDTDPLHYLICDGRALSRTTYAALYAVIGVRNGAGDGSTTFNIPDARDRSTVGASTAKVLGSTGGTSEASTAAHSHPHAHTASAGQDSPDHSHGGSTAGQSADHGHSGSTGTESAAHAHTTFSSDRGVYLGGGGNIAKSNIGGAGDTTSTETAAHAHSFGTGGASNDHAHGFGTGGASARHGHTVTVDSASPSSPAAAANANYHPHFVANKIIKYAR